MEWSSESKEQHTYKRRHKELLDSGILKPAGALCKFDENYAFPSVSAAAAVINGRPASGPREWKVEGTNETYADWEKKQIGAGDSDLGGKGDCSDSGDDNLGEVS